MKIVIIWPKHFDKFIAQMRTGIGLSSGMALTTLNVTRVGIAMVTIPFKGWVYTRVCMSTWL